MPRLPKLVNSTDWELGIAQVDSDYFKKGDRLAVMTLTCLLCPPTKGADTDCPLCKGDRQFLLVQNDDEFQNSVHCDCGAVKILRSPESVMDNIIMLARRELRKTEHGQEVIATWQHVIRIIEESGHQMTGRGLLR